MKQAGLPSSRPSSRSPAPTGDRFRCSSAARDAAHGQSLNNPLLRETPPEQPLWIHPDRAAALGIATANGVEVSRRR